MPWKRKRCWTADAVRRWDANFSPQCGSDPALGSPEALISPRRGIQRRRQIVPTAISVTEEKFSLTAHTRGLSQSATPSGESSVQIRLALLARSCRNRMFDPTESKTRCPSSVQRVRTSQFRERPSTRRSLPVPVLLDKFSDWSGSFGRADSPCSGRTDSIYDSDWDHWRLRREADSELSQSSASVQCLPLFHLIARYRHERV